MQKTLLHTLSGKAAALFMTLVLAMTMTLALSSEAYAADEDLDQTFTVTANGATCTDITKTDDAYSYYDWNTGATCSVPLYTVTIPAGTTQVAITFEKNRLVYNYDGNGNYLAGWVSDATAGTTSTTVNVDANNDSVADYIQVQRTYKVVDGAWLDGTLLYAITFDIQPVDIASTTASLSHIRYIYNGNAKNPLVSVQAADGTTLVKGTDYTVSYQSGRTKVGTYKVTIKGTGNYAGTKVLTFDVNPKATSLKSATAGSKSLKVAYAKLAAQCSGYQVRYSTSSDFGSYKTKTVTSASTASTTISSLKAKTKYYVKVRAYKTVNGKKYFSAWSATKAKTTK